MYKRKECASRIDPWHLVRLVIPLLSMVSIAMAVPGCGGTSQTGNDPATAAGPASSTDPDGVIIKPVYGRATDGSMFDGLEAVGGESDAAGTGGDSSTDGQADVQASGQDDGDGGHQVTDSAQGSYSPSDEVDITIDAGSASIKNMDVSNAPDAGTRSGDIASMRLAYYTKLHEGDSDLALADVDEYRYVQKPNATQSSAVASYAYEIGQIFMRFGIDTYDLESPYDCSSAYVEFDVYNEEGKRFFLDFYFSEGKITDIDFYEDV